MKTCSMKDFMVELEPWLDKDHVHLVTLEKDGRFIVSFLDGTKNVYDIDDCDWPNINEALDIFRSKGIEVIS